MNRFAPVALLMLSSCNEPVSMPTIILKGKTVEVDWLRTDPGRRYASNNKPRLIERRGLLAGWSCDRLLHYFSTNSDGGFDVAFLAADGTILETAAMPAGDRVGVTSTVEARYALFLADGWLKRNGASKGDRVEFSTHVTSSPPAPEPEVKIAGIPLRVEVSVKPFEQSRGLSQRRNMSAGDGMVFIYPAEQKLSFWMRDCHYALDIAFFDRNRRLLNVVAMDPYPKPATDTKPVATPPDEGSGQFVVETRKGWFREKGLTDESGKPLRDIILEMPPDIQEASWRY